MRDNMEWLYLPQKGGFALSQSTSHVEGRSCPLLATALCARKDDISQFASISKIVCILERLPSLARMATWPPFCSGLFIEALVGVGDGPISLHTSTAVLSQAQVTGSRRERVLVVDDNADMRNYLKRLLSPSYEVLLAVDGNTALALAREVCPDLIIADVMMPGMDGFALLQALRAEPSTSSIPVLLSARAGEEATVEGFQQGANDYLVKPFSARELLARVQSWLEIARLRKEAELARKHLHDLFMQAPAIICVLRGPEHVYELVNPLYQSLFGTRPLLGKPIREALPELDGQGFYELLDQVYLTGKAFVGSEVRVELDRDNTGHLEEIYFNFVYQPIRGSRGEIEGVMVHAVEVTEQVRARQQMQTFLGMASHELKNPQTSISGNIQIARRRLDKLLREQTAAESQWTQALEAVKTLLERARQQVAFQNRLVSGLIDTSRIQAGKMELRITPADLNALVREAVEEQRHMAPNRTIQLHQPSASPLLLLVDADRIKQVATNYLSNALKYSNAAQAVAVDVEATDTEVRVAVRDRGVGLSEEEKAHVWEHFYRAPGVHVQSGSGTGLGLGLYICQTIIEEHGGCVGVESMKGQGSTFWFTLPRSSSVEGMISSPDH